MKWIYKGIVLVLLTVSMMLNGLLYVCSSLLAGSYSLIESLIGVSSATARAQSKAKNYFFFFLGGALKTRRLTFFPDLDLMVFTVARRVLFFFMLQLPNIDNGSAFGSCTRPASR